MEEDDAEHDPPTLGTDEHDGDQPAEQRQRADPGRPQQHLTGKGQQRSFGTRHI